MNINKIKSKIETSFDIDFGVDESKYQEIYNFNYTLDYDEQYLKRNIKPNLRGDLKERVELCTDAVKSYEKYMKHDMTTRQCVIFKTYQGNSELAACLSLLQLIVRKGKLDLHVFTRSQNYDNNFDYDNQTYMMVLQYVLGFIDVDVEVGKVHVHVTSLHRYY
jgi:thymidylate synthase